MLPEIAIAEHEVVVDKLELPPCAHPTEGLGLRQLIIGLEFVPRDQIDEVDALLGEVDGSLQLETSGGRALPMLL